MGAAAGARLDPARHARAARARLLPGAITFCCSPRWCRRVQAPAHLARGKAPTQLTPHPALTPCPSSLSPSSGPAPPMGACPQRVCVTLALSQCQHLSRGRATRQRTHFWLLPPALAASRAASPPCLQPPARGVALGPQSCRARTRGTSWSFLPAPGAVTATATELLSGVGGPAVGHGGGQQTPHEQRAPALGLPSEPAQSRALLGSVGGISHPLLLASFGTGFPCWKSCSIGPHPG